MRGPGGSSAEREREREGEIQRERERAIYSFVHQKKYIEENLRRGAPGAGIGGSSASAQGFC